MSQTPPPRTSSNRDGRPVAVVTGGTRGIGLAIARELAPTHHLVIGGRSAEAVAGVVASLPSAADWADSMTVNVVAVAAVTRALLPALRTAHGLVITVNSGSGLTASPASGAYCASKFALRAFSDSLRQEEREHGVRVTSLHPGRVDTDMQRELVEFEGAEYDPGSYLDVSSVVRAARLAIDAGPDASVDMISVRPRGWRPTTA